MCFFYKQKPAYGVRISDWSSDVFSSDLRLDSDRTLQTCTDGDHSACPGSHLCMFYQPGPREAAGRRGRLLWELGSDEAAKSSHLLSHALERSEEHTSELQSLMRISYAVFCLKKKTIIIHTTITRTRKGTVPTHNRHQTDKHGK